MSTSSTFSQEGDCERSAIAIAWSCMTVIIACTWKAVHPNVPPANLRASKWTLACRRLYMTFWTILLPELVIWRAAREWFEARHLSATYKQEYSGDTESNAPGEQSKYRKFCIFLSGLVTGPPKEAYWTKVHSFFLIMGGFVTAEGDLIIPEDLGIDKGTTRKVDWPMVEEDEINDKSKGDMITKALVVWQTTWFVIQLVARIVEGLAITELEVMTLAYGLMCALLYGLWWNKPYDVHKPITTTSTSSPLKYSKPFNEVATEIKEETTKEETTQEERPKEEEGSALKIEDFLFGTWITVLDNRIFEAGGLELGEDVARKTEDRRQQRVPGEEVKKVEVSKAIGLYSLLSSLVSPSDVPRNKPQWTSIHSFYLAMGGFVNIRTDGKRRTIRPADLGVVAEGTTDTAPKLPWPVVEEDDIKDKRKGDTTTKALVVWQSTWFVIQLIARAVEGLAVTELEIMTLAYGLLSAFLYVLWWNKPYDVQTPMLIQCQPQELELQDSAPAREPLKVSDFLLGIWIGQLDKMIFEGGFNNSVRLYSAAFTASRGTSISPPAPKDYYGSRLL
ncbi:hypothetical protein EYR36_009686 [Pleurotus pulmonarius]|nr:hypothetical protein EYR36_009686 [Pleurotus pulmonarius]